MRVALLSAAIVVVGLAAAGVSAAGPPRYAKLCKQITGPWWTVHGGASGNRYQIAVFNYSCTTATRYVKKLYLRPSAGAKAVLPGAPRGYVCKATAPKRRKAYQGVCRRKRGASLLAAFAWAPRRS
jgi:hypothetical protein